MQAYMDEDLFFQCVCYEIIIWNNVHSSSTEQDKIENLYCVKEVHSPFGIAYILVYADTNLRNFKSMNTT